MAKIKHIALATQDPEKTANFFKEVFGLQEVGKVDGPNAVGYYLSDGNINLAILNFKNPVVAGERGTDFIGIHHIGFQVEDAESTESKLREHNSFPMEEINEAMNSSMGSGHGGQNVETKFAGPDGIMIDISQSGWVGTDGD
ncbi:MAG: VOC family protein [Chloroflexi bacterium]|nr:VOC family protein [Chloroflexota bacterium]